MSGERGGHHGAGDERSIHTLKYKCLPGVLLLAAVASHARPRNFLVFNSDWFNCFFQRLCLNGSSGQEIIISTGLETVEALAFEPLSQLLYWVNAGIPKIEVWLCPLLLQRA